MREPVPAGDVRGALQGAVRLLQRRPLRPRQRQVQVPPGVRRQQGEEAAIDLNLLIERNVGIVKKEFQRIVKLFLPEEFMRRLQEG